MRQFWQSSPSSMGSAGRANRLRSKSRSTIVATHQPVIGSLRSSNRPALIGRPRLDQSTSAGVAAPASAGVAHTTGAPIAAPKASAKSEPARSTWAVVGGSALRPSSSAIEVEMRPGSPHGSIRSKSRRSTSMFRAIPW